MPKLWLKDIFLLLNVGLIAAGPAALTAADYPITNFKALTYLVDYEPFWAPDGRTIVLISSRHGGMHVHVFDPATGGNGSDMRQLTSGDDEDDSPAYSPDGKRIAYVSIRNGKSHIFAMNVDGTGSHQVTSGAGDNIHPVWSADSRRILFNTTYFSARDKADARPGGDDRRIGDKIDEVMQLATISPDGTNLKQMTSDGGYTYASFSPDGRSIVCRRIQGKDSRIHVLNGDGTGGRNISGEAKDDGWPAWSSDSKRVVFSRLVGDSFQIFVMDSDGGHPQQLTNAKGRFTNARWSPDGSQILCSRGLGDTTLILFPAP